MSELPHLLVVDGSRVVRASLAKGLLGHFTVREEACGESAWQALILDPRIVGVIAGTELARLDCSALLEQVRSSRLCRLKTLPFFLIESDAMGAEARREALRHGVSGFLPKGLDAPETVRLVRQLLVCWRQIHPLDCAAICGATGRCAQALYDCAAKDASTVGASGAPPLPPEARSPAALHERLKVLLARGGARRGIGILSFAIDRHAGLLDQFGPGLLGRIEAKFEQLLVGRLGPEDRLVKLTADRIVIVAADATLARCARFAERVVAGVKAARISVGGRQLNITLSAGIACLPEDAAEAATDDALLVLAEHRLEAAMAAGGNRVLAPGGAVGRAGAPGLDALLAGGPPEAWLPCLGSLGLQVMPLLKEMDAACGLGLPLAEIERRLRERQSAERPSEAPPPRKRRKSEDTFV